VCKQKARHDASLTPCCTFWPYALCDFPAPQLKLNDQILAEEKHVPMYKVCRHAVAAGNSGESLQLKAGPSCSPELHS
jgi:hypothetical protein